MPSACLVCLFHQGCVRLGFPFGRAFDNMFPLGPTYNGRDTENINTLMCWYDMYTSVGKVCPK